MWTNRWTETSADGALLYVGCNVVMPAWERTVQYFFSWLKRQSAPPSLSSPRCFYTFLLHSPILSSLPSTLSLFFTALVFDAIPYQPQFLHWASLYSGYTLPFVGMPNIHLHSWSNVLIIACFFRLSASCLIYSNSSFQILPLCFFFYPVLISIRFQSQETKQDKFHGWCLLKRLEGGKRVGGGGGKVRHKSISCAIIQLQHLLREKKKEGTLPGVALFFDSPPSPRISPHQQQPIIRSE